MRNIIAGIKNIIKWFPIIWKDRDWDYFYVYDILKHKLIFMAEHMHTKGYHELSKQDGDRMMLCVRLIEKVQNEDYTNELINSNKLTFNDIQKSEAKHNKAKKLLFKILEQNIERWWD